MLEQLSESAASPVLDLDPNLNACHGKKFYMQTCILMGYASSPSQESLFVYQSMVRSSFETLCALDSAAVCTCFVTALVLFRAQTLLRADWCPMGWISWSRA